MPGRCVGVNLVQSIFDAVICIGIQKYPGHRLTVNVLLNTDLKMCLISDSTDKLEEMLQDQDERFNEMGLTISSWKAKIMAVGEE